MPLQLKVFSVRRNVLDVGTSDLREKDVRSVRLLCFQGVVKLVVSLDNRGPFLIAGDK